MIKCWRGVSTSQQRLTWLIVYFQLKYPHLNYIDIKLLRFCYTTKHPQIPSFGPGMSRGSAPSRLSYPPCRVLRHQIVQILMPNIIPPHFTSQLRARAWARAPGTFCRYWNIFGRWKMCRVLSGWNLSSSATIWSILGHKNFTRWIIFLRFIAPYLSLQHRHKKTQQSQCLSTFHFKIPSSCVYF